MSESFPAMEGPSHIDRLIQFLGAASVTTFDFTFEGRQEVCKPKYMLARDRDLIVRLLAQERDRLTAHASLIRQIDNAIADGQYGDGKK